MISISKFYLILKKMIRINNKHEVPSEGSNWQVLKMNVLEKSPNIVPLLAKYELMRAWQGFGRKGGSKN